MYVFSLKSKSSGNLSGVSIYKLVLILILQNFVLNSVLAIIRTWVLDDQSALPLAGYFEISLYLTSKPELKKESSASR